MRKGRGDERKRDVKRGKRGTLRLEKEGWRKEEIEKKQVRDKGTEKKKTGWRRKRRNLEVEKEDQDKEVEEGEDEDEGGAVDAGGIVTLSKHKSI